MCERRRGIREGDVERERALGTYYATALDIEVDPQRCCLGSRQSDFALSAEYSVFSEAQAEVVLGKSFGSFGTRPLASPVPCGVVINKCTPEGNLWVCESFTFQKRPWTQKVLGKKFTTFRPEPFGMEIFM